MLTDEQLKEIAARAEDATQGPWVEGLRELDSALVMTGDVALVIVRHDLDAYFIANSRTDIPALLAHIEHQKRALAWLAITAGNLCGIMGEDKDASELLEEALNATKETNPWPDLTPQSSTPAAGWL